MLYRRTSIHDTGGGQRVKVRTGYRIPRRVIQVSCSCQAIVPVGIRKRQVPTGPCSCNEFQLCDSHDNAVRTHKLYPTVEIDTGVPAGMGNSLYTFPEVPTMGFESGRTSSLLGARMSSIATG